MTVANSLPKRPLGRTGHAATILGLGGEGVLRTTGRTKEAVAVIHRALDQGINYFDTAPAYADSQEYYGEALGERRNEIFLASKTHIRTRDGSLGLLDQSLTRLRTDHLDLWQLHDLRTIRELDQIFSSGGAIEALEEARHNGRVRHIGITGHHDPEVLLEAMRRFDFDTVLVALNAADVHRMSFIRTVLPEAAARGMGVIGMKVVAGGTLLRPGGLSMADAMGYVLSLEGVNTVVVGCQTPGEVEENAHIASKFRRLDRDHMNSLEDRTRRGSNTYNSYKRPT